MSVKTTIELDGNFFRRNPGKTLRANVADMLDALADEMGADVKADMMAHQGEMPGWTSWTVDHTFGYTTSPRTGKHWGLWAAVATVTQGMGRSDAIRTKAAAAGIERRFHPFRKVKSAVYRSRALLRDLTKGLE